MKLTVSQPRLVEKRSDERDNVYLARAVRDGVLNQLGSYFTATETADATPVVIWSDTVNAGSSIDVMVRVNAYCAGSNEGASYWRRALYRANSTGIAAQVGGTQTPAADFEDDASWDVSLSVSGSTLSLSVTGAADKTIKWRAYVDALWTPLE